MINMVVLRCLRRGDGDSWAPDADTGDLSVARPKAEASVSPCSFRRLPSHNRKVESGHCETSDVNAEPRIILNPEHDFLMNHSMT